MDGVELHVAFATQAEPKPKPDIEPRLYEVDGISVFPVYSERGPLTNRALSYIVSRKNNVVYSFGYNPAEMTQEAAMAEFLKRGESNDVFQG
jgi:hypothetical protein